MISTSARFAQSGLIGLATSASALVRMSMGTSSETLSNLFRWLRCFLCTYDTFHFTIRNDHSEQVCYSCRLDKMTWALRGTFPDKNSNSPSKEEHPTKMKWRDLIHTRTSALLGKKCWLTRPFLDLHGNLNVSVLNFQHCYQPKQDWFWQAPQGRIDL